MLNLCSKNLFKYFESGINTFNCSFKKLVIIANYSSNQKAIAYLSALPTFQDLELHIVTVDTGDTEQANQHLSSARATMQQVGFTAIFQLLLGTPEAELEKYVTANNINLIIMGAYGHSRIRQLIIGSTTAQMLRNSHIPVLLFK